MEGIADFQMLQFSLKPNQNIEFVFVKVRRWEGSVQNLNCLEF